MGRLRHKTAIVTGAAMGIGMGIARILVQEGARVALFDSDERLVDAVREVQGSAAFKVDIRDADAVMNATRDVAAEFGQIDILVNNAGVLRAVPFLEMSREVRDLHIDVNLNGTWNCCQAVLPHMLERAYGKIINLSSVTGTQMADPGETAYGLTKAGIWGSPRRSPSSSRVRASM
jgi:NAD(P)-dependent dehydrogenase (short-subunit alcohol dehydrogenase family)